MSEEAQGMNILRDALKRAIDNGHADKSDKELKLTEFLDDIHLVFHKHVKKLHSELMLKSTVMYIGLCLRKTNHPIIATLLALDLANELVKIVSEKDKQS